MLFRPVPTKCVIIQIDTLKTVCLKRRHDNKAMSHGEPELVKDLEHDDGGLNSRGGVRWYPAQIYSVHKETQ